MKSYLYLYDDPVKDQITQSGQEPNTEEQIQAVIDDELRIYRIDRNSVTSVFEKFTPKHSADVQTWTAVRF